MIRRLKSNVLSQLPPKTRQKISFDIPAPALKDVEKLKLKLDGLKAQEGKDFEVKACIMELYRETGIRKYITIYSPFYQTLYVHCTIVIYHYIKTLNFSSSTQISSLIEKNTTN